VQGQSQLLWEYFLNKKIGIPVAVLRLQKKPKQRNNDQLCFNNNSGQYE